MPKGNPAPIFYDGSPSAAEGEIRALGHRIVYDQHGNSLNISGMRCNGPLMPINAHTPPEHEKIT